LGPGVVSFVAVGAEQFEVVERVAAAVDDRDTVMYL
jgi:hypothetical protein